tara:strand:- start:196 stop:486 length:291 start_codon:yes stop_codon:yes gene_type:complete
MSDTTRVNAAGKQLIMGMTFEFVILIIKLSQRLTNIDELSEKEMDIIQKTVCSLQSLIGQTIEVDREDIRLGAMLATQHEDMEGLREYLSETMAES